MLKKTEIEATRFDVDGGAWQWIADHGERSVPGFGVRLLRSGRKSFVLRYRTREGRKRYMTLGPWGALTVVEARAMARKELAKALDGEDPMADRKEVRDALNFREFAAVYLERRADRWSARTLKENERMLGVYILPVLGPLAVDAVTRAQVANLVQTVGREAGKAQANRMHEVIRSMFNRAAEWGFFPEDRPNPARFIERYKERSRERWLKPAEVEALMIEVGREPDPFFRAFIPLLLLTGMRKSELLSARWEHVDLDRGEILLPETKAGRPQVRKLSAPAVQILTFLPREIVTADGRAQENPHLFPARGKRSGTLGHRGDFKPQWDAVRSAADLEDVTLHDLRRTAGSYMAQAGVPIAVIGEILGHTHPAITKVYARLSQENEREALEALGETLKGLMDAARPVLGTGTP